MVFRLLNYLLPKFWVLLKVGNVPGALHALYRTRYERCPEGHVFIAIVVGSVFSFFKSEKAYSFAIFGLRVGLCELQM
ncbi:MAG TPA: hypothetical protein DDX92_12560 [Flavobacteriales bacterium]|nr:hypothetical protein [Flavobacteriales bacterium]